MIRLSATFADAPVPTVLLKRLEDLQAACVGVNAAGAAPDVQLIAFVPGPGEAFDARSQLGAVAELPDGTLTVDVTIRGRDVPAADVWLQDPGRAQPHEALSPAETTLATLFDTRAEAAVMALRAHYQATGRAAAAQAITGLLTFTAKGMA